MSPEKRPQAFAVAKYPRGDFENFSVTRCMLALAEQKRGNSVMPGPSVWKRYAPWEHAYINARIEKAGGEKLSFRDYVDGAGGPELKAGSETTGQDGGFLTPAEWSTEFSGLLRSSQVLSKLPVRFRTTSARLAYRAKLTSDWTIYYLSDNQTIPDSTAQFAQVTWSPKKQVILVKLSREEIMDSNPSAEATLREEAADALAVDRDTQALIGTGQGGTPTGLANMTNVTKTSLGATPTYANIVAGIGNVRKLNASSNVPAGQADCTGVVFNTQFNDTVASLLDSNNRPLWQFGLTQSVPFPGWLGVPNWQGFNGIPAGNTASIFYGDWKHLVVREREDFEFAADYEGLMSTDQIQIRIKSRYDVASMHPEAFFVHSNAHA